jgi:hypothetical protein
MFNDIHGDAHGEVYTALAEQDKQGPWCYTFVKDKGYTVFS